MSFASSAPPLALRGCPRLPSCCCRACRAVDASRAAWRRSASGASSCIEVCAIEVAKVVLLPAAATAFWAGGCRRAAPRHAGSGSISEAIGRLRQRRRQAPALLLVGGVETLQVDPHGMHDQERVLRAPGRGRLAQQEVLERARPERRDARVDALGIGFEQASLAGIGRGQPSARARARNWCGRIARSASSRPGPSSAASSPAPVRRSRSIWNSRSCACA